MTTPTWTPKALDVLKTCITTIGEFDADQRALLVNEIAMQICQYCGKWHADDCACSYIEGTKGTGDSQIVKWVRGSAILEDRDPHEPTFTCKRSNATAFTRDQALMLLPQIIVKMPNARIVTDKATNANWRERYK